MAANRENQAKINRLLRAVEILGTELKENPFLPEDIQVTVNGTLSYLHTRCNALGYSEKPEET